MLLAQAPNGETTKQAIEGLTEVTKAAAVAQPIIWLMIVLVLAILTGVLIYTSRDRKSLLQFLTDRDAKDEAAAAKLDLAIGKFVDAEREGRRDCHSHSLLMITKVNEGHGLVAQALDQLRATINRT